jgi:hypothetical protein
MSKYQSTTTLALWALHQSTQSSSALTSSNSAFQVCPSSLSPSPCKSPPLSLTTHSPSKPSHPMAISWAPQPPTYGPKVVQVLNAENAIPITHASIATTTHYLCILSIALPIWIAFGNAHPISISKMPVTRVYNVRATVWSAWINPSNAPNVSS